MARHASPVQSLLVDDRFDGDVYAHEPLSRHTTYRIGGPARFFVRANSVGALTGLVDVCAAEGTPWVVLGRGSNVLVADGGFPGVAIVLGRDFRTLRFDDDRFIVGAGASLSAVVQEAFKRAIGGFEFAVGTPGTVGGALRMNAGTADEWIGQRVVSVTTYRPGRGLARRRGDEIAWGYRMSSFAPDEVVLECELAAEAADPYRVRDKMEGNLARRKGCQPLSEPTCGSVFKNPEGGSAGRLIEGAGLKGAEVGGAKVSELHGNFIVNRGGATAADVRALMERVRAAVLAGAGIELVPEVRMPAWTKISECARCRRGVWRRVRARCRWRHVCWHGRERVVSTAGSAPSTGERGTPSADAAAGETAGEAGALSAGEGRDEDGRRLGDRATATSRFPGAPPRGGVREEAFRAAPRRRGAPRRPRCGRLRPVPPRPRARSRVQVSARRALRRPTALPAPVPRARAPRPAR